MYPKNEKPTKSPREPPKDPIKPIVSNIKVSSKTFLFLEAATKTICKYIVPLKYSDVHNKQEGTIKQAAIKYKSLCLIRRPEI